MPCNVINSGTPLSGSDAGSGILWTDKCASTEQDDLQNPIPISDLVLSLGDFKAIGSGNLQTQITAPGLIDHITVTGTQKGHAGSSATLKIKHDVYGELALYSRTLNIDSPFTQPYPDTSAADITLVVGQAVPSNYEFLRYLGNPQNQTFQLPVGVLPQNNFYYNYLNGGGFVNIKSIGSLPPSYVISVPIHRLPNSPNLGNGQNNNTSAGFAQDGYAYTPISESTNPTLVRTVTLLHDTSGVYHSYDDFIANGGYPNFSEKLYANYGAQYWDIINVTTSIYYVGITPYQLATYTVQFWIYPNRQWLVQPPAMVTWQIEIPPQAVYRFVAPDFSEYQSNAQRTLALSTVSRDWYNQPASGLYSLEIVLSDNLYGTTTPVPTNLSYPYSGPELDGVIVTISFKQNQPYTLAPITPTTSGSNTIAETTGTLLLNGDDRSALSILCGINGSTITGLLCGYAIWQTNLHQPIFDVSYFIAQCCNVNNVNSTKLVASVTYLNQNWTGFSTKGNQGRAFLINAKGYLNYPVDGPIDMKVTINGSMLTFQLLGNPNIPALVYQDPTVDLVDTFTRFSLNA